MAEPIALSGPASDPTGEARPDWEPRENRDASRASSESRRSSGPASVYEPNVTEISPVILNASFASHPISDPPAPRLTVEQEADPHRPMRHFLRQIDINEAISKVLGIKAARVSLARTLTFGIGHIVAISVVLSSASKPGSARSILGEVLDRSLATTGQSQWEACRWPLAAWNIVWAVKATIGIGMAVWDYWYMIKPRAARDRLQKSRNRFTRWAYYLELSGLVWFIIANVLLYGSPRECRVASPRIWWLTFELVCWGYLVAAELVVTVPVVLVLFIHGFYATYYGPNRIGRFDSARGAQPQDSDSNPPPMPRVLVDRIPLAVYIPATIQGETNSSNKLKPAVDGTKLGLLKRTGFKLFFFSRKKVENDPEAIWQKSKHPFVKLESNQAICAVCKVDFEPPRRVGVQVEDGPEAEALRLLACGHAFHMECLDPWLVEVSARCPTCRRRVELGDLLPVKKSP
ncbi:hypothetical protein FRC09_019843 [Ceratobasidium sp. 395]|nr:hypothetical protein FRC09_019843 [Ceratobasidium sp. 395]